MGANNVENVSVGKPKVGGAVYRGGIDSDVPTSANASLGSDFACLGYCSDAGVVNSNSMTTTEIHAWGGDLVAVPNGSQQDNFKIVLIESKNADALKAIYGDTNVTGTAETGITIKANSKDREPGVWVDDMELSGNFKKRIVIPDGRVTAVADVAYVDNDVIKYEVTVSALPDSTGNTHYEYIIGATGATGATNG